MQTAMSKAQIIEVETPIKCCVCVCVCVDGQLFWYLHIIQRRKAYCSFATHAHTGVQYAMINAQTDAHKWRRDHSRMCCPKIKLSMCCCRLRRVCVCVCCWECTCNASRGVLQLQQQLARRGRVYRKMYLHAAELIQSLNAVIC